MKQSILKDGKPHRFLGNIPKEYEPLIEYICELSEDEISKVPEIVEGKLKMRDKTQAELDAEQVIKDAQKAKADKEKMIQDKIRETAIKELEKEGKL